MKLGSALTAVALLLASLFTRWNTVELADYKPGIET